MDVSEWNQRDKEMSVLTEPRITSFELLNTYIQIRDQSRRQINTIKSDPKIWVEFG